MRRFALLCALLVVGALLAACNRGEEVIPTVAQLPSVTPDPNAAAGGEVFVTHTPEGEAQPLSGDAVEVPAEDSSAPPGFASPTPETLAEGVGGGGEGCTLAGWGTSVSGEERAALQAGLDDFMARLTSAAGTLGDWTLDLTPNPALEAALSTELVDALLRYRRASGQQVMVGVLRVPPAGRDFLNACLQEQSFYDTETGLEQFVEATVSVTPLSLGERAAAVTITVPATQAMIEAGIGDQTITTIYVLVGDTYLFGSELRGGPPVSTDEVVALMTLLVGVVQGL